MGGDNCVIFVCKNDRRYPDRQEIHSNVKSGKLSLHRIPKAEKDRLEWLSAISSSYPNHVYTPGKHASVCSNHFVDGKPTKQNPYPTLFLSSAMNVAGTPPRKYQRPPPKLRMVGVNKAAMPSLQPTLKFEMISKDSDVSTFTGFANAQLFQAVFDFVKGKARVMTYWVGVKDYKASLKRNNRQSDNSLRVSDDFSEIIEPAKPGRSRQLSLEQEFLLVMMKLRMDLMVADLAFRFGIGASSVSKIIITWVKLLAKELHSMIIWPSRSKIRATLPNCFRRIYPKVRTIIDCTEIFFETPGALDVQACMWSDYKHHCTVKFLVSITPNGAISWVSPLYGGRASDLYIVRDSGFLDLLEPFDQVMADRGFKIKTDLANRQCTLCIPPSAASGAQMLASDVRKTSNIANVRIYVEQAIKRMKHFHILQNTQPMLHLPIMNDIVQICGALTNLYKPLVE